MRTYRICQVEIDDIISSFDMLMKTILTGKKALHAELNTKAPKESDEFIYPLKIYFEGAHVVMFENVRTGQGHNSKETFKIEKLLAIANIKVSQKSEDIIASKKEAKLHLKAAN